MSQKKTKNYPGDMTKEQEELLLSLVPGAKQGGRPRSVDIVSVINAIFYVLCTGCPWRWLPHDYPPYGTVYDYFRKWKKDGTWVKIHDHLRGCLKRVKNSVMCLCESSEHQSNHTDVNKSL